MQPDVEDSAPRRTSGAVLASWTDFLAIGECMVEIAPASDGGYGLGYAGDSFNTAWYLRRLCGAGPAIDYLSGVGDDAVSAAMVTFMHEAGIGTDAVRCIPGKSVGLYLVTLTEGERSFSYWRSASAARELAADLSALKEAGPETIIYFSGITLAILAPSMRKALLSALTSCRAAGARVAFDPNIRPRLWEDAATMRQQTEAAARVSDIVFPSFDDEAATFGDAGPEKTADRYLGLGAGLCIVKNAAEPIHVAGSDIPPFEHPVRAVSDPVDTTAAGDAFNAGVLAGIRAGGDLRTSIEIGSIVSRMVISGRGALVPIKIEDIPFSP